MRTHYLIISICCFLIGVLLAFCIGCYHSWPVSAENIESTSWCERRAELCEKVVKAYGIETRKIYGWVINNKDAFHVQTQALLEGEWKWLDTDGKEVFIGEQDYWFEPQYYIY